MIGGSCRSAKTPSTIFVASYHQMLPNVTNAASRISRMAIRCQFGIAICVFIIDIFWGGLGRLTAWHLYGGPVGLSHRGRHAKIFGWAKSKTHAFDYGIFDTRQKVSKDSQTYEQ